MVDAAAAAVGILLCIAAPRAVLCDGYDGGYPDYPSHPFTLPCGSKHPGTDTSEVSEWPRYTPAGTEVSGRMKDYTWATWGIPPASTEEVQPTPAKPELRLLLTEDDWIESAKAQDWDAIPVTHPGTYVLGVLTRAPFLVACAGLGLLGALFSMCCICGKVPKQLVEFAERTEGKLVEKTGRKSNGEPSRCMILFSKVILGGFLVVTLFMAWSMEIMGNRSLNTAVHHAIHSVEGITNYVFSALDVADDLIEVGRTVLKQIEVVNGTVFSNADPTELAAISTCLAAISSSCSGASLNTPTPQSPNIPPYFEVPNTRVYPDDAIHAPLGLANVNDPRQSCSTSGMVANVDYKVVVNPLAGICVVHCLAFEAGCTGAQWISATNEGCLVWFNNRCSTNGAPNNSANIVNNDTMMLYQRTAISASAPTVSATQAACIQRTTAALANIHANLIDMDSSPDMQYSGTGIRQLLSNLHTNQVDICDIANGTMASSMSSGFGLMPAALDPAQKAIHEFHNSIADAVANSSKAVADLREQVNHVLHGDGTIVGQHSMWLDSSGQPYPKIVGDDNMLGEAGKDTTCTSLNCIDNTFDLIDSAEPYDASAAQLPYPRTLIFTALCVVASIGAASGIYALVVGKTGFWKLCCFLFLLWGPVSLLVCAPIQPIFMFMSDACVDLEDVAIQVAVASATEINGGGSQGYVLVNGSSITEKLVSLDGFNFTNTTVDNIEISSVKDALEYYLKGCQTQDPGASRALNQFQATLINITSGLAGTATSVIDDMGASLPAGMVLRPIFLNQVKAIVTVATDGSTGVRPVIEAAIDLVQCPRVSQAYFEIKAPICCDIVVAFYWLIYPLSMLAMCTCMPMCLSCCLGKKAFYVKAAKADANEVGYENPVHDTETGDARAAPAAKATVVAKAAVPVANPTPIAAEPVHAQVTTAAAPPLEHT